LFRTEDLDFLINAYWSYRSLENQVQAVADEHTHEIAKDKAEGIEASLATVEQIVSEILGRPTERQDIPSTLEQQEGLLRSLGYSDQTIKEYWPKLISLTALSTRTYEDEQVRRKLLRYFCEHAAENSIDPDLALSLFTDFVRNTRAKTSFFY